MKGRERFKMKKNLFLFSVLAAFLASMTLAYAEPAPSIPNMTEGGWKMTHDVGKMLGAGVTNRDGQKIAKVKDFVMDRDGRIAFAILGYTGENGVENLVGVPYSILFYNEANKEYITDLTRERLAAAPKIHDTGDLAGHQFAGDVYRYFGVRPYWESAESNPGMGD
jgi:hypothetical protein